MSKTLAIKMISIMERVQSIDKGGRVSLGASRSYTAVLHDDVAAALHPEFVKEKVWVKTSLKESDTEIVKRKKSDQHGEVEITEYVSRVRVVVSYINAENPPDREECEMTAYSIDSGDKGIGKAVSMAVKYAHLKNFTLESVDEEEKREGLPYEETRKHSGGKEFAATDKQVAFIKSLCEKKKYTPMKPLDGISAKDASALIEKLNKMEDAK